MAWTFNPFCCSFELAPSSGGGGGAVDSVNGQTGVVVLDTDDVAEGTTNKYYTAAQARTDLIASSIVDGDTTHSPDGNSVFDALATKQATGNYITSLTGDVTGTGPGATATTIAPGVVTLAKMANMPANTIRGNNTGVSATPLDLTATQTTAMLDNFVGENGTVVGTKGLVPAPAVLDGLTKRKFLRGDGSWSAQTKSYSSQAESIAAIGGFVGRYATANQWFGICWAPEICTMVAVASSGTNRIAVSKNGEDWREIAAPSAVMWTKICWSSELKLFVAVAFSGNQVMTSSDGVTWTLRTCVTGQWYDICWSPQRRIFCATSLGGGSVCMTSPDGITWTSQTVPAITTNMYCVDWSPELGQFCAFQLNAGAFTSPDGVTWTARTSSSKSWSSVKWCNSLGLWVACGITGTGRVDTSPDGITWTTRSPAAQAWRRVVWAEELGMVIIISSGGQLAYSFDGITWNNGTSPESTNQWYDGVFVKELGFFVIAGITGTNRLMSSRAVRRYFPGFNPEEFSYPSTRTPTAITLTLFEINKTVLCNNVAAQTITIPLEATTNFRVGSRIKVVQTGAGVVSFTSSATIRSRSGLLNISAQYGVAWLEKIGPDEWLLDGDLA